MRNLNSLSRYLSLILRHHPEAAGITLDEHGWADVGPLIEGIRRTRPFDLATLEEIVRTDEKQRYSFSEDHALIRANQGHSVPVDVELERLTPPDTLWHGTAERFTASIEAIGLIPKGRLYVHLSGDPETAVKVGARHGKPALYQVLSDRMAREGRAFYRSVNGVWLTERVPPEFLKRTR